MTRSWIGRTAATTTRSPAKPEAKWNAAFAVGGPLCTVEQVEQTTGIRIDDFVVIDFNGFKEMVDAVGGVEICVPEEINDPERQIFVPQGTNELRGDQALDYVRARYDVGTQSDLGRIKRQQNFMASMINRVVVQGHARPRRQAGQVPQRSHQVARRE